MLQNWSKDNIKEYSLNKTNITLLSASPQCTANSHSDLILLFYETHTLHDEFGFIFFFLLNIVSLRNKIILWKQNGSQMPFYDF